MFGGGGGKDGGQTLQRTPEQEQAQKQLLEVLSQFQTQNLGTTNQEFSKGAAIADSRALLDNIFRDFKNNSLPEIFQNQVGSGGYNSTTGQLLANDAYAAATAKSAQVMLEAILKYKEANQNDFRTFAQLMTGMTGASPLSEGSTSAGRTLLGEGLGSLAGAGAKTIFGSGSGAKPNVSTSDLLGFMNYNGNI